MKKLLTLLVFCLVSAPQASFSREKTESKSWKNVKVETSASDDKRLYPGGLHKIKLHHKSKSSENVVYAFFDDEKQKYVVVCQPGDGQYQDAHERCEALSNDVILGRSIKNAGFSRNTKNFRASKYKEQNKFWQLLSFFYKHYPVNLKALLPPDPLPGELPLGEHPAEKIKNREIEQPNKVRNMVSGQGASHSRYLPLKKQDSQDYDSGYSQRDDSGKNDSGYRNFIVNGAAATLLTGIGLSYYAYRNYFDSSGITPDDQPLYDSTTYTGQDHQSRNPLKLHQTGSLIVRIVIGGDLGTEVREKFPVDGSDLSKQLHRLKPEDFDSVEYNEELMDAMEKRAISTTLIPAAKYSVGMELFHEGDQNGLLGVLIDIIDTSGKDWDFFNGVVAFPLLFSVGSMSYPMGDKFRHRYQLMNDPNLQVIEEDYESHMGEFTSGQRKLNSYIEHMVNGQTDYNEIVILNAERKNLAGFLINKVSWDKHPGQRHQAIDALKKARKNFGNLPVMMYDSSDNSLIHFPGTL